MPVLARGFRQFRALSSSILLVVLLMSFPVVPVRAVAADAGTLVDDGFESGTDGALLDSTWTLVGTPLRHEYDSARAAVGSMSGWVAGPTNGYGGVVESDSSGMTSDGAEVRFWAYFDSTSEYRHVSTMAPATAQQACALFFWPDGQVMAHTLRTGDPNGYQTGYTSLGAYQTGWTEYRIVYDFSNQTYTVSTRSDAADPWTQLKGVSTSSYDIPFRGTDTITQTYGTKFFGYKGSDLWIDEVRYSDAGISDG